MRHLNNHLLVAVGLVVDGNGPLRMEPSEKLSNPQDGNICQLALIPLNVKFEMSKDFQVLNLFFKPRNLENFPKKDSMAAGWSSNELTLKGYSEAAAMYVFEEWFEGLGLRHNKKLVPLAFNWPLTRAWLNTWLSDKLMNDYFDYQYRDLLAITMYHNDWCYAHNEPYRFQKPNFNYVTKSLDVSWNSKLRDAALDALALSDCYDKLMLRFLR